MAHQNDQHEKAKKIEHEKVLQPQKVDLGGLGHGHEVKSSVKVGRDAHQNDQHGKSK